MDREGELTEELRYELNVIHHRSNEITAGPTKGGDERLLELSGNIHVGTWDCRLSKATRAIAMDMARPSNRLVRELVVLIHTRTSKSIIVVLLFSLCATYLPLTNLYYLVGYFYSLTILLST